MVFLGGAVLANIVSLSNSLGTYISSQRADGGQGGYVDIKGGVAGAGLASTREAGCTISFPRKSSNLWTSTTIELWRTEAIFLKPLPVSLAQFVSLPTYKGRSFHDIDTAGS
jgi:hypothetical protein